MHRQNKSAGDHAPSRPVLDLTRHWPIEPAELGLSCLGGNAQMIEFFHPATGRTLSVRDCSVFANQPLWMVAVPAGAGQVALVKAIGSTPWEAMLKSMASLQVPAPPPALQRWRPYPTVPWHSGIRGLHTTTRPGSRVPMRRGDRSNLSGVSPGGRYVVSTVDVDWQQLGIEQPSDTVIEQLELQVHPIGGRMVRALVHLPTQDVLHACYVHWPPLDFEMVFDGADEAMFRFQHRGDGRSVTVRCAANGPPSLWVAIDGAPSTGRVVGAGNAPAMAAYRALCA